MAAGSRLGVGLVLATAAISGVSIFLNAYAVKGFDSDVFTFGKNALVALVLAAVVLSVWGAGELRSLSLRQWLLLALIGLVGGAVPFLLFFKGFGAFVGAVGCFVRA
ncbi:MAG: EamA family transporter [Nitrosarchaeum sp.]|nr:EamA family transporter [Nitrosarchaeum sp.]